MSSELLRGCVRISSIIGDVAVGALHERKRWSKACNRASNLTLEQNTIVLAVRNGSGNPAWSSLRNASIYLQILDEKDGRLIFDERRALAPDTLVLNSIETSSRLAHSSPADLRVECQLGSTIQRPFRETALSVCLKSPSDSTNEVTLLSAPAFFADERFEFLDQFGNGNGVQLGKFGCCSRVQIHFSHLLVGSSLWPAASRLQHAPDTESLKPNSRSCSLHSRTSSMCTVWRS